ncbi:electron transporter [Fusobacterium necrophorum subsp. funduliforme]|uniref:Electron transfer flavoprotein FAD-binding domain protein n=5 Tax=Fusobacterium TaxID=848 RepID=A0AAN3VTS2_9FUSO|nr:electron transfer flavoprotein subunit alpha/FixB family protein [Fusobacterium necrophorum]AYV94791.1 electron transfer flavoprotein subunit alpha/FixB family protein [Fusobacterium necrophorum subsp. funduliforme]AYZ72850.1 electron transfer flavoprotein subunit alpha/FixB family protein [Fusobacterium necrophorum]AZW09151.1 electron transfer flavoprotein subunit alpha/FixB family protein [Fusobacterium necrophorum subsp. necrophorum]EGR54017.1 electron transfer flavoprotein FAD-binding do
MNTLLYIREENLLGNRSQELLNIVSFWKKQQGGKISVAMLGGEKATIVEQIREWPIENIFFFPTEIESSFPKMLSFFQNILGKEEIDCICMGNGIHERELAPYLAAAFAWKFIPNIVAFELKEKEIAWKRFLYGTRAVEESVSEKKNIVVTISGNIYKKEEKEVASHLKSSSVESGVDNILPYLLKAREQKEMQKHPLETAKIVIGVGKGIKGKENFPMIEELADLMGATIGVTRSVVDNGWRPEYEKIGQTGKIIKPELYLGFGISGAMQHMAGVQQARHIIMVNNNPNAESFRSSDFGIVADLFEVVPKLISMLKAK